MKLYEINENASLTLTVSNANSSLEYEAVVAMKVQNFLLLEPILHEGKMLNFDAPGVNIKVFYVTDDGKPLMWQCCSMKNTNYSGKRYHVLYSKEDGRKLNRRDTYRLFLGVKGHLLVEETHETFDVTLKDISEGGVGFICSDTNLHIKDIGRFRLSFQDNDRRMSIHLSGNVIREKDIDNKRRLFGAKVSKCNIPLGEYIALKQKSSISRRRLR